VEREGNAVEAGVIKVMVSEFDILGCREGVANWVAFAGTKSSPLFGLGRIFLGVGIFRPTEFTA
jgi:hypothetical protein